jgi:prolyl-tRNA synthetase
MRTRLFLRTAEFLWQEGHTAHATKQEAKEETDQMVRVYEEFSRNILAIPTIMGHKTESERFAGAEDTLCIEGLMQDGKALQMGTSHFLGQNFAKAFDVKFASKEGKLEHVWATSWGVSTRLMGALIMAHSDDEGLVLPPNLAPIQVVIVPIYKGLEQLETISEKMDPIIKNLRAKGISVKFDSRDTHKPGFKFAEWELKGVPVRIAIGNRDIESGAVEVARRDTKEKQKMNFDGLEDNIESLLATMQDAIFNKALNYRDEHITEVNSWEEFQEVLETKGGFISAHWDGTTASEDKIQQATKATIRCIPFDNPQEEGVCIFSGKPSKERVLFAKAY